MSPQSEKEYFDGKVNGTGTIIPMAGIRNNLG